MADGGDNAALFPYGAGDVLQALAIGKIPHDGMSAGKIDRVVIGRIDLVGPGCCCQQRHAGGVGEPGFRGGIQKRPFERARLQRRDAAFRAYNMLVISLCRENIMGMG